jgi:hypothetical protein
LSDIDTIDKNPYYSYFLEKINDRLHQTTVKKATNAKSNELQPRYGMTPVTNMTEVESFPPDILTDMSTQDYY